MKKKRSFKQLFEEYTLALAVVLMPSKGKTKKKFAVNVCLFDENIRTTVDSGIAKYYVESYLQDQKSNLELDRQIDLIYEKYHHKEIDRASLKLIADQTSLDFSAIFLVSHLIGVERNYSLQQQFLKNILDNTASYQFSIEEKESYQILFVPGWDYVENGDATGANFKVPRELITKQQIENHLVPLSSNGSVEDNANQLAKEIIKYSKTGKDIILVGASSAGPAIHFCLGGLMKGEPSSSVRAWINIGGILQGSPLVDHFQSWPQYLLFLAIVRFKGWEKKNILSMAIKPSRERFKKLTINKDILTVNYLPVPLSGRLSEFAQAKYPLLAVHGPNDGLTLLTDAIAPESLTIVALGRDHFLAEDPDINSKTIALTRTVISLLEQPKQELHNSLIQ